MTEKPLSYYRNKAKTLNIKNSKHIKKIALLNNFTINGLSDVIKVMSNEQNMDVEIYESAYGQYRQEILNKKSGWHIFKPELTFLLIDFDSVIGDAKFEYYAWNEDRRKKFIKETQTELENLLSAAINTQNGKIVVSNFQPPIFSPLGIFDPKIKYSMKDFVNSLNSLLRDLSYTHSSLYVLELDSFFQYFGSSNVTDEKWRYVADMKISPSYFPKLAKMMLGFIKPLSGFTKKCLVLDLDNSLWGGILGEEGINGILLDEKPPGNTFLEFQKVILQLHRRGIILAINSKNNLDDVKEVFEKHPKMILKENHFASIQINWNDKVTNMISISKELNIGIDSFVFWDDDPVNRELIKEKLPEIIVVNVPNDPSLYVNTLQNLDDFNSFQITEEDMQKGQMYAAQNVRKKIEQQYSNIDDFLSNLQMKVIIKKADDFTIPRISQLTMKTNQFNLTTKRYSEEDIKNMVKDPNYLIKTFSVSDKFGDNGLTGLYIVKKNKPTHWIVDTFLMSCRIMGRNIEQVMLADLIEEAKKENVEKLSGQYIPTKKNLVAKELYQQYGFSKVDENTFVLNNVRKSSLFIPYIEIKNNSDSN